MPITSAKAGWREWKKDKKRKKKRGGRPFQWRLKPDETRHGTVLDDKITFFAYTHTIKTGPKDYELVLCRRSSDESDDFCPGCEEELPRSYAIFFSIIDHKKEKDRKGNSHQYQRKIVIAKSNAIQAIHKKLEKLGSLRLVKFEVTRGTEDNSPNAGTIWEVEKTYEEEQYKRMLKKKGVEKPELDPIDYSKYYPILSPEKMLEMMGKKNTALSEDDDDDYSDVKDRKKDKKKKKKRRS